MSEKFEQISLKQGFMKHNGGVLFRNISNSEYEFKNTINENHLNAAGITHGGYLSALVDAGAGTAAHRGRPTLNLFMAKVLVGFHRSELWYVGCVTMGHNETQMRAISLKPPTHAKRDHACTGCGERLERWATGHQYQHSFYDELRGEEEKEEEEGVVVVAHRYGW